MLTDKDREQLKSKNISTESLNRQLSCFSKGFPYARLQKAATLDDGIIPLKAEQVNDYAAAFKKSALDGLDMAKFVPASGAATRMFKDLFTYLQSTDPVQQNLIQQEPYNRFITRLDDFAFSGDLKASGLNSQAEEHRKAHECISKLLLEEGLDYGQLPKGLLKFHSDGNQGVTPFEEHLRETAGYCKNSKGRGKVHFTVSPEHHAKFKTLIDSVQARYEALYNISYEVSFSYQKPSTDTIAANPDNTPFRNSEGLLLFRPGGHGALIENLNDMDNELVFIKNIDNVVPEHLQADTILFKKALGGLLLSKKARIFGILRKLEAEGGPDAEADLEEALVFMKDELQHELPEKIRKEPRATLVAYVTECLNRPIRVCGMVKNEGEPGGGPFWVKQSDGSISLQIVEGAQIDPLDKQQQEILMSSTHFNPVDLVCYLKDYKGHKFNLLDFVDPETGFISEKTQNGKPLKALELPGLWNGAMARWLTFFVEVPVSTFNPVKTVMDLLRPQHQPA